MADFDERRQRHARLAARLAGLDDAALATLVAPAARAWRPGWGETVVIDVDGEKTFVKKISLSALEQEPGNAKSTANIFGLPMFYQYGVGSGGFGAWRELRAQVQASEWALAGECACFPMVHHWRVLPRTPPPIPPAMRARLDSMAAHWNNSSAVAERLDAMFSAPAQIVVFLEYAPEALHEWKARVFDRDNEPDGALAAAHLIGQLREATAFMNARGMQHFDLHSRNLMTDGDHLLVCDFGLALSSAFDLSPEERAFLAQHRQYDRAYIEWAVIAWLAERPGNPDEWSGESASAPALPPVLDSTTRRYRPVAGLLGAFLKALREDKTTPYPEAAIAAALAAAG